MRPIFISYRHEDSEGHAGRLCADLVRHFGKGSVFIDVTGIALGIDFRESIDENVASCGVLLAVIGKDWLHAVDPGGKSRLENPADFVRLELSSALKRNIPVVPVLVQGASIPPVEQLPVQLKALAYRKGMELSHARWDSDVRLLVDELRRCVDGLPGPRRVQRPWGRRERVVAAAITLIAVGGSAIYFLREPQPATAVLDTVAPLTPVSIPADAGPAPRPRTVLADNQHAQPPFPRKVVAPPAAVDVPPFEDAKPLDPSAGEHKAPPQTVVSSVGSASPSPAGAKRSSPPPPAARERQHTPGPRTSGSSSRDRAIEREYPEPTTRPEDATPVPEQPPLASVPFDKRAANATLNRAARKATTDCGLLGGPPGTSQVQITYDASGHVIGLSFLSDGFEGAPVGYCIRKVFLETTVPRFSSSPTITVKKSFYLRRSRVAPAGK